MIVLYVILAIIVIILIAAASLSSDYTIETELAIDKPKQQVYDYVRILKNSDHFNKWVMMDPNMQKEYVGTDGTVGFVYKWNSEKKEVGQGEQEIVGLADGEKIDYEIRFIKPFTNVCGAAITTNAVNSTQTNVSWSFYGKRSFGMKIFHLLFNLPKVLKRDLHTSLVNLKNVLEK